MLLGTRKREVTEDRLGIAGLWVRRVDRDVNENRVTVGQEIGGEFETKWEEINWRWARSGLSAFQNHRAARGDNREEDFRE